MFYIGERAMKKVIALIIAIVGMIIIANGVAWYISMKTLMTLL